MSIETPEYLIGCGGNSSGVVERLMKKEWILEEAIGDDRKLKAMTVDSATGSGETEDRDSAETEIQNQIDDFKEREGQSHTQVEFEHYNYVLNTADGKTTKSFLTNTEDIQSLTRHAPGVENCWWLDNHEDLLSGGFGNGVDRRRALSKALYHVSAVHDDSDKTHPHDLNVGSGEDVVIVVSLGGGTGSGTFLDIAQDISPDANVHLFAVIPDAGHGDGESDGSDELASAHAALSELEYLEVTGDSPFENIVVTPYLEQAGISDEDFEEGLIYSILSYLSLIEHDNGHNHITPGNNNAIDSYHSFVVSIPRIVEYDAGRREDAQEDVEEYLETRQQQLRDERGSYQTVEHFLQHNFPNSFGDSLEMVKGSRGNNGLGLTVGSEEEESHLVSMMVRLEDDIQETFLRDSNLQVAGVDVEAFLNLFEEMYAAQGNLDIEEATEGDTPPYERVTNIDTDSAKYAEEIVHALPAQMIERIRPQSFDDPKDEQIAKLLVNEAQNIQKRSELIGAIYSTDPGEVDGLEPERVRDVQHALIDVVLDPDTRGLVDEFPRGGIGEIRDDLWESLLETELDYARLTAFDRAVRDHLENELSDWWTESASDDIEIITGYNKHREELAGLLEGLDDACRQKANQFSKKTVDAERIGLRLLEDGEEVDISRANEILEELGVDERIDQDELIRHIRNLKQAKEARDEYSGGGLLNFGGGSDLEHQFDTARETVNEGPYFEVSYGDIEDPFNVEYRYEFTTLLDTVDTVYEDAVEAVVDELEGLLTDKEEQFERLTSDGFVGSDEIVTDLEDNGATPKPKRLLDRFEPEPFTVPAEETRIQEALEDLTEELRTLDGEEVKDDYELGQQLGIGRIVDSRTGLAEFSDADWESETVIGRLVEPYLEPIWEYQADLETEIGLLGSTYLDEQNEGLYQALERLVTLADKRSDSPSDEGLGLTRQGSNTQHGPDLTESYEEFFQIPSTEEREPRDDNVFRRTNEADNRDLVDDPSDIAESRVWSNKREEVLEEFAQSIRAIRDNDDDRCPVQLNELEPKSDETSSHFEELRLLNVYASRQFELTGAKPTAGGEEMARVREVSKSGKLSTLCHNKDGYLERQADFGDPWTFTLVTFMSGFTLDMLEPVTASLGYAETYDEKHSKSEHAWRNHSLGLDGDWDSLGMLSDRAEAQAADEDWWPGGGAFVRRDVDDLHPPSKICDWTLKVGSGDLDKAEVENRFESAYTVETFPSFIDL